MTVDMQELARALDDLEWWDDAAALRALVAEKQRLREALSFYADPVSYENATPRHVRPVISDGGAVARAALDYAREEVA